MNPEGIAEKGRAGEQLLNEWFNRAGLSYVFISQEQETFARLFQNVVKRPDFLLLLDSIGIMGVDAKNYTRSGGTLTLHLEDDVKKALMFERIFRLPMWFAFVNEKQADSWLWISALKALEVGDLRDGNRGEFLAVKIEDFVQLDTPDDMGKLYTQRMPSYGNVAKRAGDTSPARSIGRSVT